MKLKNLLFWQKRKKPSCATKRCFFWKELGCKGQSVRCPYQDLTYQTVCSNCKDFYSCNRPELGYGCPFGRSRGWFEGFENQQGTKKVYFMENGVDVTIRGDVYSAQDHIKCLHAGFCLYKYNYKKKKISLADYIEKDGEIYVDIEKYTFYREALNMFDFIMWLRLEGLL